MGAVSPFGGEGGLKQCLEGTLRHGSHCGEGAGLGQLMPRGCEAAAKQGSPSPTHHGLQWDWRAAGAAALALDWSGAVAEGIWVLSPVRHRVTCAADLVCLLRGCVGRWCLGKFLRN